MRHGKSQAQSRSRSRSIQKASPKNPKGVHGLKKTLLKKKIRGLADGAVIRRTDKDARPHIERRCTKVAGKTVGQVLATPISYVRDGKSLNYGLADLRYDLQFGYLTCSGGGKQAEKSQAQSNKENKGIQKAGIKNASRLFAG